MMHEKAERVYGRTIDRTTYDAGWRAGYVGLSNPHPDNQDFTLGFAIGQADWNRDEK